MRVSLISPGRHHDGSPRTELNFKCQKHKKSIFTNYLSIKEKNLQYGNFYLDYEECRDLGIVPTRDPHTAWFAHWSVRVGTIFSDFYWSWCVQVWVFSVLEPTSSGAWIPDSNTSLIYWKFLRFFLKCRKILRFLEIFSCFSAKFSVF